MPIYEYVCKSCGNEVEKLQKISDQPLKICPTCGKLELERLISKTSFQLKGTGWYVTDFKDKGTKKEKPVESKETKPQEQSVKKEEGESKGSGTAAS